MPEATRALAVRLGESLDTAWLAGILDLLGDAWEAMPLWQKIALFALIFSMLALGGASLWLAFSYGMTFMSLMGSAHAAAAFTRDPSGTIRQYLATHTPGEIAMDIGLWALEELAGRGLGKVVTRIARHADTPSWRR